MAIITGLAGLLGRFAGRFLNSTLGWATMLLFGKVPQSRQTLLLLMVLASLGWVAAVIGVIFPDVGSFLIAAVPAPDFVDETWIRLAMLVAAIALPLAVGVIALVLTEKDKRPTGVGIAVTVARGYPFTLVLTLTIVILAGVALFRKLRSLSRRWQDAHVPVVVKPGGYELLITQLRDVLVGAGLETTVNPAPRIVSAPPKLLDAVAGRSLGALVPDRLMLLSSVGLEVLVYPSDLAMSGSQEAVARAQAAIVSKLTEAPAYMTTSAEAQSVEDQIEEIARSAHDAAGPRERARRARQLDERLARLVVPFDEWEILYRERLQLERDALAAIGEAGNPAPLPVSGSGGRASRVDVALAAAGLALIALDVAVVIAERRSRVRIR